VHIKLTARKVSRYRKAKDVITGKVHKWVRCGASDHSKLYKMLAPYKRRSPNERRLPFRRPPHRHRSPRPRSVWIKRCICGWLLRGWRLVAVDLVPLLLPVKAVARHADLLCQPQVGVKA
jgi:hypothetical protein